MAVAARSRSGRCTAHRRARGHEVVGSLRWHRAGARRGRWSGTPPEPERGQRRRPPRPGARYPKPGLDDQAAGEGARRVAEVERRVAQRGTQRRRRGRDVHEPRLQDSPRICEAHAEQHERERRPGPGRRRRARSTTSTTIVETMPTDDRAQHRAVGEPAADERARSVMPTPYSARTSGTMPDVEPGHLGEQRLDVGVHREHPAEPDRPGPERDPQPTVAQRRQLGAHGARRPAVRATGSTRAARRASSRPSTPTPTNAHRQPTACPTIGGERHTDGARDRQPGHHRRRPRDPRRAGPTTAVPHHGADAEERAVRQACQEARERRAARMVGANADSTLPTVNATISQQQQACGGRCGHRAPRACGAPTTTPSAYAVMACPATGIETSEVVRRSPAAGPSSRTRWCRSRTRRARGRRARRASRARRAGDQRRTSGRIDSIEERRASSSTPVDAAQPTGAAGGRGPARSPRAATSPRSTVPWHRPARRSPRRPCGARRPRAGRRAAGRPTRGSAAARGRRRRCARRAHSPGSTSHSTLAAGSSIEPSAPGIGSPCGSRRGCPS